MFCKKYKPLMFLSFIFKNQIIGTIIFKQRNGDSVFFVEMLLKQQ